MGRDRPVEGRVKECDGVCVRQVGYASLDDGKCGTVMPTNNIGLRGQSYFFFIKINSVQRGEVRQTFNIMICFLCDNDGFEIIPAMHDPVADVDNLFSVDTCFGLQVVQKVCKGT